MLVSPISSQPFKAPLSPVPPNQVFLRETKVAALMPDWNSFWKSSATVPPARLMVPKPVFMVTVLLATSKALSEATLPKAKVAPLTTLTAPLAKATPYGLVVLAAEP